MAKRRDDMTLEELWQLYPIILEEHNNDWDIWYNDEFKILERLLCDEEVNIYHIGSTAVQNIKAKPTVDILIETDKSHIEECKNKLKNAGYLHMNTVENPLRYAFNKGYEEYGYGDRVFHIHLRLKGDNKELYFRDYLIEHPDIAKEYEKIKIKLAVDYRNSRDEYTMKKSDFINKITNRALVKYNGKYK